MRGFLRKYLLSDCNCDYDISKFHIFVWITYIVIKLDGDLLINLMEVIKKPTTLTLIDLGEIEKERDIAALLGIIQNGKNVVVAFSSGSLVYKRVALPISVFKTEAIKISFTNFSEKEVGLYVENVSRHEIDVHDITVETNGNPRLIESRCLLGITASKCALSNMKIKIIRSLSEAIKASTARALFHSIKLLK
jgi:hypothetical protein